jgi:hypothetical protein
MDFKTDILPWVQGLALPISILTAAGAYYYRTRVEHQRMANRVLYYLLELRTSFRILNSKPKGLTKELMEVYLDCWKEHGLDFKSADIPEIPQMEGLINQMVESLMAQRAALPDGFLPAYRSALNLLSERDPISAFRINGSEDLNLLFGEVERYNQQAKAIFSEDHVAQAFISQIQNEATDLGLEEPLKDLDNTIRVLSRRCSWPTRYSVGKVLKKKKMKLSEADIKDMRKSMRDTIKGLIPKIIEMAKAVEASKAEKLEAGAEEEPIAMEAGAK